MAESRRTAMMIAQSELAAVGPIIPSIPGTTEGTEGDFYWRVDISAYAQQGPQPPAPVLGQVPNPVGVLCLVTVHRRRPAPRPACRAVDAHPGEGLMSVRREGGYTLVEMLASLVIVGMAAAMMVGGITTGRRVWEHADTVNAAGETISGAQMLLREKIERAYPATRYDKIPTYADFYAPRTP